MSPINAQVGRSQARIHRGKKMVRQSSQVKSSHLYFVMQFNMELLFQLRELFIKYSILLD